MKAVYIPHGGAQHSPPITHTASERPAYRALRLHECASSQRMVAKARVVARASALPDKAARTFTMGAKTALGL